MIDARTRAELYALVHRGNPGDLEWYLERCGSGSSVLELGCGFGRISLALARAGCNVTGLDNDPVMLELAARSTERESDAVRQRLRWVRGDMRDFALDASFDRVLLPHNGLYCLLEPDDVARCLRCARAHVARHGELNVDVYHADAFHEESCPEDVPDDQLDEVTTVEWNGTTYEVFEKSRWDRERQRIDATYVHRAPGVAQLEYVIEQRYLLRAELAQLLDDAGFAVSETYGGFAGEPLEHESDQLVVVARPD